MSKRACRARTTAPVRWAKAPAASRTAAEPAGRPGERDRDRLPALRSRRPPRPETPIFERARSAGKARAANPFLRRKNAAALACARQGPRRSAAAPGAASPEDIASQRPATAEDSFWIAACSFARPLGRAEARRGDHLSDLDGGQSLAAHGLHRAARGQAGRRGAARTLAGIEPLVVYFATIVDVGGPGFGAVG